MRAERAAPSLCDTAVVSSHKRALVALALLCAGAVAGGVWWYRTRPIGLSAQYLRLPSRDAVILFMDFAQLRRAGLLQLLTGSHVTQDSEYRRFVNATSFDYTRDLDTAMVSFAPSGKYLLLNGRFNWNNLRAYALAHDGDCQGAVCRMVGSAPDRRISYSPLRSNTLALAVSTDDLAVQRLERAGEGATPELPGAPVWLRIPGSVLKSSDDLPSGTRMFAHSMERADSVTLTLSQDGTRLAARLDVVCPNEQDAASIASDLTRVTAFLKDLIEREHQSPSETDLSGVLTSGSFRSQGRRVYGYWPIERQFVVNMLSGAAG
jgi:hypothetical protein